LPAVCKQMVGRGASLISSRARYQNDLLCHSMLLLHG
jgi:hypothetical protein